jgi:hypothetical protein
MPNTFKNSTLIWLLFAGISLLAQDTIQPSADMRYREDQFYVGLTYNLITDVPGGVATRGLSGGMHFGFLRDMPINEKRNVAIAVGVGMSLDRMGQTLFIGEDANNETIFRILDGDNNFSVNRFSVATIEAPIQLRWRTSTASSYKFWRVYAGFRLGYSYWYKSTYRQSNNDVFQTDISEFDRVRLGTSLSFGYNTFNFYVYYSINPFFKDAFTDSGQQIEFRTIKVGLMFYIL